MSNRQGERGFPAWLLWIIGPVTVLAAAIIVFSVVLGIQAGQRQVEMQRRQQIGIALQRAIDYRSEGLLQEALEEYRRVLVLEPNHPVAVAEMQNLLQLAGGVTNPAAQQAGEGSAPAPAAGNLPVAETPAAQAASPSEDALYTQALNVYQAGQWQQAMELLVQLQSSSPTYQPGPVSEMLFNSYVNLAAAKDQAGDLEQALEYVDLALAIRPDSSALRAARTLAANYLEAVQLAEVNTAQAIALLEEIYVQNPSYRDVRTQLHQMLLSYGDRLSRRLDYCGAAEQYTAAIAIEVTPGSIGKRDTWQAECAAEARASALPTPTPPTQNLQDVALVPTIVPGAQEASPFAQAVTSPTTPIATTEGALATDELLAGATPIPAPASANAVGEPRGSLLFSALDPVNGRTHIYVYRTGSDAAPSILVENGQQPAMRPDGQRLVYRNLRDDMRGISSFDPASGLNLRFTTFGEDSFPSWNGEGNRVAFASNREGDRLWRIYNVWGDVNNEALSIGYGDSPQWHPFADQVAFRGCDSTGNGCGIRVMNGNGGDSRGLTGVSADNRAAWAPNGAFAVFMSDGRDGNLEIYRVDVSSGQVTRLTDSGSIDALPTVSPDGNWVAFFSNRGGPWAIWAVPSSGGEARQLTPVPGGLGSWMEQGLQWIN
jgi:tetratricopeptide (TPR) repeat protein